MSRYTGPRLKLMRALGVDLPGLSRKSIENRNQPPGQHGVRKLSARKSEFGLQLMEKQKIRYHYGLTERQLRRAVVDAQKSRGAMGNKLIELLERRLDNLVFRAGFAPTIPAARQLVSHGHIRLNGRRVNIPSIRLRVGDIFGPSEAAAKLDIVRGTLEAPALEQPVWIAREVGNARLSHLPEGDAAPFPLDLQRVVEYYASRL